MPYTPEEIQNIQNLARHADMENVLLAFELIKGQGLVPALETDIYWIFNRVIWEGEEEVSVEIQEFLRKYWAKHPDWELRPLMETPPHPIASVNITAEQQVLALGLDLGILAECLYVRYNRFMNKQLSKILFKYGNSTIREKVIQRFSEKEANTGRSFLDLGGFKLGVLPEVVLREKQVQMMKIWGNDLEELPDFWGEFRVLEVLNIAENKLKNLPESFIKLQKLQKLYAQGNHFDVNRFINIIRQLPNLKFLSVASSPNMLLHYTLSENTVLRQFEELVNQGKMHASEKTQQLILALYLEDKDALKKLSLMDFFEALSDTSEETRKRAKLQILHWKNSKYPGVFPKGAAVAALGIVSFATRNKFAQYQQEGIKFSAEIEPDTTHILVGDFPENYGAIRDRKFTFLSEEDI